MAGDEESSTSKSSWREEYFIGEGPIQIVIVGSHGSKRKSGGEDPNGGATGDGDNKITPKSLIQTLLLALIALCLGGQAVISGVSLKSKHEPEKTSSADDLTDTLLLFTVLNALQPKQPAAVIESGRPAGPDNRVIYPPTPMPATINSPTIVTPQPQPTPSREDTKKSTAPPAGQGSATQNQFPSPENLEKIAFSLTCGYEWTFSHENLKQVPEGSGGAACDIKQPQGTVLVGPFVYKNMGGSIEFRTSHSDLLEAPSDDTSPKGACSEGADSPLQFKPLRATATTSERYSFSCNQHTCPGKKNGARYFDLCLDVKGEKESRVGSWRFGFKIDEDAGFKLSSLGFHEY